MARYIVHQYAVVRVKCMPVEAASVAEAVAIAEKKVGAEELNAVFSRNHYDSRLPAWIESTEYADDAVSYLVDVEGDEEYAESVALDALKLPYRGALQSGEAEATQRLALIDALKAFFTLGRDDADFWNDYEAAVGHAEALIEKIEGKVSQPSPMAAEGEV